MKDRWIEIVGAREHNLRVEKLSLPKDALIVFTGVSGSGKSSLAFDTLYAEGQRRYVESLSSYARQFLGRLDRPDVEHLRGLSPTIAIEQKTAGQNPRSTVGTITEIYDYLRVLYARAGVQHCPTCGKVVESQSAEEIVRDILLLPEGTRLTILAPKVAHRKGAFDKLFEEIASRGYVRARVNGELVRLEERPALDKKKKHTIEVVVDRVSLGARSRGRLTESVEAALLEGEGEVRVEAERHGDQAAFARSYSEARTCCGQAFPETSPQSFSFNTPLGMCPECHGLGTLMIVDPNLVVPDASQTIRGGAVAPWATSMERGEGFRFRILEAMSEETGVDLDTPFQDLSEEERKLVFYGVKGKRIAVSFGEEGDTTRGTFGVRFEGVLNLLMRRYRDTTSERMRQQYAKYLRERPCAACGGLRLRPESLAVRVGGLGISELTSMTVTAVQQHLDELTLSASQAQIAEGVLREIGGRLRFLLDVGLSYLTLDRAGPSLSGGEAQRIRLASQLGSELSGVLYVLDEPSIGLHPRDTSRLVRTLEHLHDLGNTVIVVEHDEDTIRAADHLVDFGPGAGHLGGEVMFSGSLAGLERCAESLTGQYLSGKRRIEAPTEVRPPKGAITLKGATENNLRGEDVVFPLGQFVAVTGVSGAGKSSLVSATLLPALMRALGLSVARVGAHEAITGVEALDRVISIDQRPIGRTPRSNPGTYTKAFDEVRAIFAQLPEARTRGFDAGRFSFNVKGGRCEACTGDGVVRVEMHFLSDVYVPCEVCKGRRYNSQTLDVLYKGRSIADVLDTSVDECLEIFGAHPRLARVLGTLVDVGLGYVKLGQPATTLSGGEAQRVKLSRELGKRRHGRTLYVLDEPTVGLHFEDVRKLLGVLDHLVEAGNTVLVIEHDLDVVLHADHVIDVGPEGGAEGGRIVCTGTPHEVARCEDSYTGQHLAQRLGLKRRTEKKASPGGARSRVRSG